MGEELSTFMSKKISETILIGVTSFLLLAVITQPSYAQSKLCTLVDGAVIINDDGEFIGRISDGYAADSIYNKYGRYGSEYQSESIWNHYGKNGSEYQSGSAFNRTTSNPPMIVKDRKIIGYLSINKNFEGSIHPLIVGILCYDYDPK